LIEIKNNKRAHNLKRVERGEGGGGLPLLVARELELIA